MDERLMTVLLNLKYPGQIPSIRMQYLADWIQQHPLSPQVKINIQAHDQSHYILSTDTQNYRFAAAPRFLTDSVNRYERYTVKKLNGYYTLTVPPTYDAEPDIFDCWFYFLSCYAEQRWPHHFLDKKSCYLDSAHILVQNDLHHIPICDHNLEVFWQGLGYKLPAQRSQYVLTHDIDYLHRYTTWSRLIRTTLGTFIRRKNIRLAYKIWSTGVRVLKGIEKDPYNTFDRLLCRSKSAQKILYLLVDSFVREDGAKKDSKALKTLAFRAIDLGYKIAIHPSYSSAIERQDLGAETQRLSAWIGRPILQTRQHFLRLDWGTIFDLWEEANLEIDSSIGFRNHVGFRLGTAFPLLLYNLTTDEPSLVREIPLVYMDVSAYRESQSLGVGLLQFTKSFLGPFEHNSHICFNIHNSSFDALGIDAWCDYDTYSFIKSLLKC